MADAFMSWERQPQGYRMAPQLNVGNMFGRADHTSSGTAPGAAVGEPLKAVLTARIDCPGRSAAA